MGPVQSLPGIVVSSFLKDCLLLPGHYGSTLRAFALNAGHAAFVWFRLSAFRTQAGADSASRKGTTLAASTLSSLTLSSLALSSLALALSAAFSHSTAFFSFHFVFLLVYAVHFLAPPPAATAAARHGKGVTFQIAKEPDLNDLAQIAGHERDHVVHQGKITPYEPGDIILDPNANSIPCKSRGNSLPI
jgi:hypothetical protein